MFLALPRAGDVRGKSICSCVTWRARIPCLQAIAELVRRGKITRVVSQNVDGLHLRSGVPRDKLAELHGNCFAERCPSCKREYIRDFEIETVRAARPVAHSSIRFRLMYHQKH